MQTICNKHTTKACKFKPIKLLQHQEHLLESFDTNRFPLYVCWGMGSGKTIGACMCMSKLSENSNTLIICDKSTVIQWKREAEKLLERNHAVFPENLTVDIIHYEYMERDEAPDPRRYDMTIVDESHRFRNAWDKQSHRMLRWFQLIQQCPRVIYLSGTPIIHDADIELRAFYNMMGPDLNLKNRVFFYDPRTDRKSERKYPKLKEVNVECEMTWSQCFMYLKNKRQTFSLMLEGDSKRRILISSSKNTFNTMLRSICNNPFPDNPQVSPKFQEILKHMEQLYKNNKKQVVYSSRKDTGVKSLKLVWDSFLGAGKTSFQITGDMQQDDRAYHITTFNRTPNGVLFITDAGAQGIDLKRVDAVIIMEPTENLQEERQIINRAIRYNSHSSPDSEVSVLRFVSVFPRKASVAPPWKRVLYESGLFEKEEMKGITRRVQYALKKLFEEEEHNETIDERILKCRIAREADVQGAMTRIMTESSVQTP